jgi:2-oxoglutarate ferredoxin oxidoreductase subunit beta
VEHGKPLVFGKDKTLGLRMPSGSLRLEVVQIGVDVPDESHLLVHDETSPVLAQMLARMDGEELPVALGVLYRVSGPVYELQVRERSGTNTPSIADLQALISGGHTWEVH